MLKVVEQIAFLAAPLYALFFLVIDKQVISLVFGANWIPSCVVIPWLLVFAYFRLINTPLICMLSAKGRPGVNAKVNLTIAPLAVVSFLIGAWNGGILGVSIAVTLVLGIVWTEYWWWVGCRELGWQFRKFLIPCLKPPAIALVAIFICLGVPIMLKPFLFIAMYLVFVRLLAEKQFFLYHSLVGKVANRLVLEVRNR